MLAFDFAPAGTNHANIIEPSLAPGPSLGG